MLTDSSNLLRSTPASKETRHGRERLHGYPGVSLAAIWSGGHLASVNESLGVGVGASASGSALVNRVVKLGFVLLTEVETSTPTTTTPRFCRQSRHFFSWMKAS